MVSIRALLIGIIFFADVHASSRYSSYGLPGQSESMRIKVFAYDGKKAEQVLAKAEETCNKLSQTLGQAGLMFKDCLIFFWKDRESFLKEGKKLSKGSVSEWAAAFSDYRFSRKEVAIFAYETDDMFSNILPHELTHQVLAQGLSFTGTPHIPLWLNEGLAQYMEEDKENRHSIISSAVKENSFFSLKALTDAYSYPEENISLFYAQSLSLVEFFLENYTGDKFYSLARRLVQEMSTFEKALKSSYWPDINTQDELKQKWLVWIKGKGYFNKTQKDMQGAESADGYVSLTLQQKKIIADMKKKVDKRDRNFIWTSEHFSIRMEYPSRNEMGINEAVELEDIYAAYLFILEEAYNKIGDEIGYHPAGKREVYLYASEQYADLKSTLSDNELIQGHPGEIVLEVSKTDRIRNDLVYSLYYYYAYISLLNKGETGRQIKRYEPIAAEWGNKGERISTWKTK